MLLPVYATHFYQNTEKYIHSKAQSPEHERKSSEHQLSSPAAILQCLHSNAHNSLSSPTKETHSRQQIDCCGYWDHYQQICWLTYTPDIPGEWSCLWWASAVAALGSAGGCSPEGPQSLCDSLAADRPSNTDINHRSDYLKRIQPLITVMGLKTVSSATHFWLGGHQHGPHLFQFLGFSLSFLLQTCVFLFYVQAFLLV